MIEKYGRRFASQAEVRRFEAQYNDERLHVTVVYDGGINPDLDRLLRRVAGFQSGVERGSGSMMLPPYTRDLGFAFDSAHHRDRFIENLAGPRHHYPLANVRIA